MDSSGVEISGGWGDSSDSLAWRQRYPFNQHILFEVDYKALDSIVFIPGAKKIHLYQDAHIKYGAATELKSDLIDLDWKKNEMEARYEEDTISQKAAKVFFKEKDQSYLAEQLRYNFKSNKVFVRGIVMSEGDGYIHGDSVRVVGTDTLMIRDAKYTTCSLADPHYYIQSSRVKLLGPKKIITGPFFAYLGRVPLPVGFFFGVFPQPGKKNSGILHPSYGEDRIRGFFLRRGGYYFDLGEYADLTLLGDAYSKGSYGFSGACRYKRRYFFDGNLDIRYNSTRINTRIETEEERQNDLWVEWSHIPVSRGGQRFQAGLSGGTFNYNQNNLFNEPPSPTSEFSSNPLQNSRIRSEFNSNVSYTKSFIGTPFNTSINFKHKQNIQTRVVDFVLPNVSLNMRRVSPLQRFPALSHEVFEKFGFSYSSSFQNQLNNLSMQSSPPIQTETGIEIPSTYALSPENFPLLLRNARRGVQHTVPVSTSITLLKYFITTSSFRYQELWYDKFLDYHLDSETHRLEADTVYAFSRAGFYRIGESLTTQIYGTTHIQKGGIEAIRHVLFPTIGLSYSPDFGAEKYGYYQEFNLPGQGNPVYRSRYSGFALGSPPRGDRLVLSLELRNSLEMKLMDEGDAETTKALRKIPLLENFSFQGGYNFLVDSFQINPVSISVRTTLFQRIQLNLNMSVDPYLWEPIYVENPGFHSDGLARVPYRRVDLLSWKEGGGIGQLTGLQGSVNMSLTEWIKNSRGNTNQDSNNPANQPPLDLNLIYNLVYRRQDLVRADIRQNITLNGRVQLTPLTKVGFSSGYDFREEKITYTSLNFYRDIHCWELQGSWIPFGRFTSYEIAFRPKSRVLKSVKWERRRTFVDVFQDN
ncbi:MAG: putative LPS assembly protein LptD [Cytophagales bacterium]|nr:putative LPS assembly protein LptD [Cytophagales bacterium]